MSVRRLAEDAVQPQGFAFSAENAGWAEATIRKYPEGRQQSAVIPLLMRAQEQEGWVTKAAIEHVAQTLSMPMIRVLEVATFYTQFQLKPVGRRAHVQICGTTPCMLRGSDDLKAICRSKIHAEPFHLNESGTLSWEEVECLGACVNAPMVMIAKDTYEDLTGERLGEIIDAFAEGKGDEVRKGPQIDRHLSVPVGGLTTLNSFDDEDGGETEARAKPATSGGAAPQGAGSGEATTPPSQAGRPDTSAAETDPTIAAPGKATNGNANRASETAASIDPSEGAGVRGAGKTGGTKQGETGAAERDEASFGPASSSVDGEPRSDGPLNEKGKAAESAVVQDFKRVDGDPAPVDPASVDLSGKDHTASGVLEGQRTGTDDEVPGPAASDAFTAPATPQDAGERPQGLLSAAEGPKDDLKAINGVGPVIEAKLNALGVYHFRQVAGWTQPELAWIDNQLNFRGRAVRDRWVEQAKALQSGSDTVGSQ